MKTKVFVSYTSKDPHINDERLKQVEACLKPFATVFIDRLHNKKGGQCRVNYELWRSDVLLQLVSKQHQSEWVQKELLSARKKDKPVIKVGIDEFLKMDQEQVYLLLSDVDKKGWSVWSILIVSLLVCVGISLAGIWFSYLFVAGQVVSCSGEDVLNARGLFGDSWGGVNALISAFAFAGVIVTLFLQNRDLNLQRKEMARQREEFEKENETLKNQRFENLFYNMLNLQQRIVDGLKAEYDEDEISLVPLSTGGQGYENRKVRREISGREVFRYKFESELYEVSSQDGKKEKIVGLRNLLYKEGLNAYNDYWAPTIFDHYFRHLYKIVQFIDNQGFNYNEAYRYVSFLRGTLSRHELVWIYYNALFHPKFKLLIEKYTLLKSLRPELLTLTSEADAYYREMGLKDEHLRKKGFSTRDYEYYMTDNPKEPRKYQLTAFWKPSEIAEGEDFYRSWQDSINGVNDQSSSSR